ncbi:uncharacterized protein LOC109847539 [Asparagus officinalis]|uniref:uncharacterized protein LOC109847539 n=1 Tax=Asparagus officinalis TaxID=4686 RepID=UPI00098DE86C|nr:uncharacterized protein LOC109847539 [Asparagus officinalis]
MINLLNYRNQKMMDKLPLFRYFTRKPTTKKRKVWVNEKAQDTYERLVNKTIEQSQPEVKSLMNEFEISIDVLGRRPGYLKGYGIYLRRSSSTRSIAKLAERDAEVVALKETVAVQAEQIASQTEQMNAQAEQMNAQAQKTANLETLVHQLFARSQPGVTGGC